MEGTCPHVPTTLRSHWVQASLCTLIKLEHEEDDKSLSKTTTELLSAFENCTAYIFDWALRNDFKASTSTKYFRFYSESLKCAIAVDTATQYRNKSTNNPRFENMNGRVEPHLLFTKYTNIRLNFYDSGTSFGTILEKVHTRDGEYTVARTRTIGDFIGGYNIPFNYVLIVMNKEESLSINGVHMFSSFVRISIPAVYILILNDREACVIGFAHALQFLPFLFKIIIFQEAYIRQLYEMIHKDLKLAPVLIRGRWRFKMCGDTRQDISTLIFCAVSSVVENFNLTYYHRNYYNHFPRPDIYLSILMSGFLVDPRLEVIFTGGTKLAYDIDPSVLEIDEFDFICVSSVHMKGLKAFVQAYDMLTWIVTATACLCMSAAIAGMSGSTTTSFWNKLQSSAPVVVMFLIERFYGYGRVIRSASRQIVLVITLWAFAAMLLGMCYSGNIVSELTSPSLPPCPHDLKQLVLSEYPILTVPVDNEYVDEDGRKIQGTGTYFDKFIKEFLSADTSGTLVSLLGKFGKVATAINRSAESELYAYASTSHDVKSYGMLCAMHGNEKRVLRGGGLHVFNIRRGLLLQRNYFSLIFRRFLGALCQSGAFKLWTDINEAEDVGLYFITFLYREVHKVDRSFVRKIFVARIWRNFQPLIDGEAAWSAVTLENLSPAFKVFSISMLLCLLSFFGERCPWQVILRLLVTASQNCLNVLRKMLLKFSFYLYIAGYWRRAVMRRE